MDSKKIRIGLVPVGNIPAQVLPGLAAFIPDRIRLQTAILPPLPRPTYAYDPSRRQYNAAAVITALESMTFADDVQKVVGILNVDLFIPIFTHVLGEAREGGRIAIASIYRLSGRMDGGPHVPLERIVERLVKVAVHELGHLFDLGHCPDRACMMHYSGNLTDLDRTPLDFCPYCRQFLSYALERFSMSCGK